MQVRIKNIFEPSIIAVELSEKELEYITAIISGVEHQKVLTTLHMTPVELSKLYIKFGLKDKTKIREVQIATITGMSGFVTDELFKKVAEKYGFSECLEMCEA